MNTPDLKEQLITKIDQLSSSELEDVLEYIEVMEYTRAMNSMSLPEDYRIENDGLVGFLSGTTDLAEQIEAILYGGADLESPAQKAS